MLAPQHLRVFQTARRNLASIATICAHTDRYGDLHNQIKRASIGVCSSIAEACGSGSDRQRRHHLCIARGSNQETRAQLLIMASLGSISESDPIHDSVDHVNAMLTKMIRHLSNS